MSLPRLLLTGLLLLAAAREGLADPASIAGLWQTVSDVDGKPRGEVRISERNGVYSAAIVRSLVPGEEDEGVCEVCPGARRGQPFRGLVFLTGLRRESETEYGDGEILDPDTGRVYRCKARLEKNGRRMVVRGFIGVSLFGRSQEWIRVD